MLFRVGGTLYRGVMGVLALIPVRARAVAEELVAGSIGVTAPLAPLIAAGVAISPAGVAA